MLFFAAVVQLPSLVFGALVWKWGDDFNSQVLNRQQWTTDRTGAYGQQSHNAGKDSYNKLDLISPSHVILDGGNAIFKATKSDIILENGKNAWITGLLTTEYTKNPATVKTGYYVQIRFQLPGELGAWPGLWTWKDGSNEVDSFEYHPDSDSKNELEFSNHVRGSSKRYKNPNWIFPRAWLTLGTYYGEHSVDWFVNNELVHKDGKGVGSNWNASLILNLSVCAGYNANEFHSAPNGTLITFKVDYVAVYEGYPTF